MLGAAGGGGGGHDPEATRRIRHAPREPSRGPHGARGGRRPARVRRLLPPRDVGVRHDRDAGRGGASVPVESQVGSGILPVWSRSAGDHRDGGGHARRDVRRALRARSGGEHAAARPRACTTSPFATPVARMRRTVTQVRALLQGERIPLAVTTSARPLKLNVPALPPSADLPRRARRRVGAPRRGTGRRLATVPLPALRLGRARELLAEGAARAASPGRRLVIAPSVPTVVDRPHEGAAGRRVVRRPLPHHDGTLYRESLVRYGFGKEVEAVLAANTPEVPGVVPPKRRPSSSS